MRGVGSILIFLGVVLAVLAGISVFLFLYNSQPAPAQVPTAKLIVASQEIVERSEIGADQVTAVDWPSTLPTPIGAFDAPGQVVGKLSTIRIYPGQPIQDKTLIDKSEAREVHSNAALLIEKNMLAIAFPVTINTSVAEAIQPGDRVDLIATFKPEAVKSEQGNSSEGPPVVETHRLLQDVLVLQVGPWPDTAGKGASTAGKVVVTVQVNEQDAAVIKFAQVNAQDLSLALRSANDHELYDPTPVSIDYIKTRFGYSFEGK
ncbi:MAG: Flp pilus assembly protein CpaB [Rudaea sp.]